MYPIFRPILNKGGAGRSLSRVDTVDALNPLVEHHGALLAAYSAGLLALGDRALAERLETVMTQHRTELGKLRESVLANGGVPPTGIGIVVDPAELGDNDGEILHAIETRERAYRDALKEALDYPHHQIRTIAILENNVKGSEERIGVLRPLVDRTPRRPRRDRPVAVDETTTLPADLEKTVHDQETSREIPARRAEKSDEN
jgi:hypothetical protein